MAVSFSDKIVDLLLKKNLITAETLKKAKEIYTEKGEEITEILVRMNFLTREALLSVLAELSGYPPVNLARINVDKDVLKTITKRVSLMYMALPVARFGNFLTVAMVDPSNIFALDDLAAITRLQICPLVADGSDMREAVARFYERSADEEIKEIVDTMTEAKMEMISEEAEELSSRELLRIIEDAPVVKLTNLIISQAVRERSSDILVEPMENNFRVRYRIDGVLYVRHTPPKKLHCPLISRIKVMSNLNIAERRLPQDGRFRLKIEGRKIDFRVSILPSVLGEKAALRILDREQVMIDVAKLGLMERDLGTIVDSSEVPHGMILASGPTGSGKTTTLYSILKHVDSPDKNLVTVEDPVEYELKGVNQVNVRPEVGLTFAGCLRSILRQDPDIILIGEIRDLDTVDIAIKSALTGHLVLSTLHTNTASGSIVRLINMGVEPFLIASSFVLIIAQRLIRRLCLDCRERFMPTEIVAKRYGLFDKDGRIGAIYRPKGCPRCMNSGYKGRAAIVECMRITPPIKELLVRRASETEIERQARTDGMVTLRENGMENVLSGVTSLEEVLRITAETGEKR